MHYYHNNNEAGVPLVDKLSLKILGAYIFSYSDLKCNLSYAIHMKTSKKMVFFSQFLHTLFFIFLGRNSKKAKHWEILHFKKHSSLCNRFGKRTMFFVFSFFHFLCKFRISTSPLSVTKNKISINFQNNLFGNID